MTFALILAQCNKHRRRRDEEEMDAGMAKGWSTRICLDIVVKSAELVWQHADGSIMDRWMDSSQASWMDGWIRSETGLS